MPAPSPPPPDSPDSPASLSTTKAKLIEARMLSEQTSASLPPSELPPPSECEDAIKIAYDLGASSASVGGSPGRRFEDDATSVLKEMDESLSNLEDWRVKAAGE